MAEPRHTPQPILAKLRELEVPLARGTAIARACTDTDLTEPTSYRRREAYRGL